ncbi:VOC family protein [Gracilibacillus kekensis]|uniref:VOC domain-containing protein n=1 Tax=Gracilibacillus kekensis TaxID=1027249 RepID=A0A1M7QHG0_9BACI|nr:VOC family protein [Gracilibacillus kekensis]SHN30311.1 hypothetical protein SAMN05216179_3163 [Gracilibacillus kekensis]
MNRINLICLGVKSIPQAIEFYKSIGFETSASINAPVVFFNNRGTKLELFEVEALAKDINEDDPPKIANDGFRGMTLAINMKSKQEVDDFMHLVERHGGQVAKTPETVFWGGYSGYFMDPDGYYWEVAYSDEWKFDENDMLVIE